MQVSYHIRIQGRVQGVSFRYATLQKAKELGVNGYVQNKADGSVFVFASGAKDDVHKLIEWCYQGPSLAKVTRLDAEEVPYKPKDGFTIV